MQDMYLSEMIFFNDPFCQGQSHAPALEVQALIAEAQKRKLFLMEGLWTRFIPATEKVLSLLNSNVIGTVSNLKADFGFQAVFNKKHRLFDKSLGGGSLLDIGIYPLYISLLLLGVPVKIGANARMTDTGVDATCEMVLCYNDSVNAQLKSTIENDTPTQAVITGEKGTITIHKPFHHSQKITVQTNGYNQVYELPYECFGYLFEIEEVNSCLAALQTESTKLPLQTSFELHRIIDRVLKKIQLEY